MEMKYQLILYINKTLHFIQKNNKTPATWLKNLFEANQSNYWWLPLEQNNNCYLERRWVEHNARRVGAFTTRTTSDDQR
jgi:hypothetical protein